MRSGQCHLVGVTFRATNPGSTNHRSAPTAMPPRPIWISARFCVATPRLPDVAIGIAGGIIQRPPRLPDWHAVFGSGRVGRLDDLVDDRRWRQHTFRAGLKEHHIPWAEQLVRKMGRGS